MAKKTITGNKDSYEGTNAADTLIVQGSKNTVKAGKGKDKITIYSGSGHRVYGEAGVDTITVGRKAGSGNKIFGDDAKNKISANDKIVINGGKKNYIYGGKGNDTITINAGKKNYIYGDQGNDTFVIGKKSTGTAVIKDFGAGKRNTDTLKIVGGTISKTKFSKQNMIITAGKSTVTLAHAKGMEIQVVDSRGSYTMSDTSVRLNNYKGTINTSSFSPSLKNIIGTSKKDTITISGGSNIDVYADSGSDTITVNGGSEHGINGGSGDDKIFVNAGSGHRISKSGNGYGQIVGSDYVEINKDAGDEIVVDIFGDMAKGNETIIVNGGNKHWIQLGNEGKQNVTVNSGDGHSVRLTGRAFGEAKVTVEGGNNNQVVCSGNTHGTPYDIKILKGENHTVKLDSAGKSLEASADITVAAKNVSLDLDNNYKSNNVIVQWSGNIGTLYIESTHGGDENAVANTLTIDGANSNDFTFSKYKDYFLYDDTESGKSYYIAGLSIDSKTNPDCKIQISDWWGGKSFTGITFGNGEFWDYEKVSNQVPGSSVFPVSERFIVE